MVQKGRQGKDSRTHMQWWLGDCTFNTNSAIATYKYYTGLNYQGQTGAYLAQLANNQLRWEQKMDYNVGVDLRLFGLGLSFDYYISDTENFIFIPAFKS